MGRHMLLLLGVLALAGGGELFAQIPGTNDGVVLTPTPTLTFTNGRLPNGSATTYRFTTATDNGIVRLVVDSAGTNEGAVPSGWAEIALRAQDEIHDRRGRTLSSSDVFGQIITTSKSFGFSDDPKTGHCRDAFCPETTHLTSANLRLIASGQVDVLVGNRRALVVTRDNVYLPDFKASPGTHGVLCVDDAGALSHCDNPSHLMLSATTQTQAGDALRLSSVAWGPPKDLFTVRGDGRVQVPRLASVSGTTSTICVDAQGYLLQDANCGSAWRQIVFTTIVTSLVVNLLAIAAYWGFRRRARGTALGVVRE